MSTSFTLSFEFFPPKTTEAFNRLSKVRTQLTKLSPGFFSVTFGAGGSTRDRTFETIRDIQDEGVVPAAPHLSCIGSTKDSINELLEAYQELGVARIVALRGDLPSGMGSPGEFRYASELVAFIRKQTGDYFDIEVAAYPEFHPQSQTVNEDLDHFKHKVEAGANSAITQYFYNADAYEKFIDDVHAIGVDIPIVPGIMPITNYVNIIRFSDACGAEIPRWIRKRLATYADDPTSILKFGEEVVTDLCQKLIKLGAPGLHFYTLNQAEPTTAICSNLALFDKG